MLGVEISLLTFDVGTCIARIEHLASNSQLFNTTIHIFIMHSIVFNMRISQYSSVDTSMACSTSMRTGNSPPRWCGRSLTTDTPALLRCKIHVDTPCYQLHVTVGMMALTACHPWVQLGASINIFNVLFLFLWRDASNIMGFNEALWFLTVQTTVLILSTWQVCSVRYPKQKVMVRYVVTQKSNFVSNGVTE